MTVQSPWARAYLAELVRAARWLPRDQADELHEQIAAHLNATIDADADVPTANAVLQALGQPGALVREAVGPKRRLRIRLRRMSWISWLVIGIVVSGLAAALTVAFTTLLPEYNASSIECGCGFGFLTDGKLAPSKDINIAGFSGIAVTARRSGQGFELDIVNPSDYPQTVLGLPANALPWGGDPSNYVLGISTRNVRGLTSAPASEFALPVTISPHGERTLQIEWRGLMCSAPGTQESLNEVSLRVKIGPFVRTESLQLETSLILDFDGSCPTS